MASREDQALQGDTLSSTGNAASPRAKPATLGCSRYTHRLPVRLQWSLTGQ